MDITIQELGGNDAIAHVSISAADYSGPLNKELKRYQGQARIPGFRPGKAPMGMIKKMVERDIKPDLVLREVERGLIDHLRTNEINTVLGPILDIPEGIDWSKDDFSFDFVIGLQPEINLDIEALNGLVRYDVMVGEEDIEKELEGLSRRHAQPEDRETYEPGPDMWLKLKIEELDENGEPLEGGVTKDQFFAEADMPIALVNALRGAAKAERKTVNLTAILDTDELNRVIGVDEQTAADLNPQFAITLQQIMHVPAAELDQKIFDEYFGEGQVTDVEGFKERMKDSVAHHFARESVNRFGRLIHDTLRDTTPIELPKAFLKRHLEYTMKNEKDYKPEEFDHQYGHFLEEMRWHLIAEKVSKEQEIQITEEEIRDAARQTVSSQLQGMKLQGIGEDFVERLVEQQLKDKEHDHRTRYALQLRDTKVINWVLDQLNPLIQSIDVNQFEQMQRLDQSQRDQHDHGHELAEHQEEETHSH